jgi:26S proteasome regulatory subunit N7
VKKNIDRAKALVDSGGDWDRRNRLKAYQGLHLLTTRSYNLAAPLLLDSLSTFTSYELCSYSSGGLSVLAGSVSLKRVDFKAKSLTHQRSKPYLVAERLSAFRCGISRSRAGDVFRYTPLDPPQSILQPWVSSNGPAELEAPVDFSPLASLVNSLYIGDYRSFFLALAAVEKISSVRIGIYTSIGDGLFEKCDYEDTSSYYRAIG